MDYARSCAPSSKTTDEGVPPSAIYQHSLHMFSEFVRHVPDMDRLSFALLALPQHTANRLAKILPTNHVLAARQILAVNHIKVFVFDDNVVITGANLSKAYFSNRQDRYVLIRNAPALADWMFAFTKQVCQLPGQVLVTRMGPPASAYPSVDTGRQATQLPNQEGVVGMGPPASAYRGGVVTMDSQATPVPNKERIVRMDHKEIEGPFLELVHTYSTHQTGAQVQAVIAGLKPDEALIIPRMQFGGWDIDDIRTSIMDAFNELEAAPAHAQCFMSSGYLNPSKEMERKLIAAGKVAPMHLLMASEDAIDFNEGGHCMSSTVKQSYSSLSTRLLRHASKANVFPVPIPDDAVPNDGYTTVNGIRFNEYKREGWTFHAKGMWILRPNEAWTSIGSANFGRRSEVRDLECQLDLFTRDPALMERLKTEVHDLFVPNTIPIGQGRGSEVGHGTDGMVPVVGHAPHGNQNQGYATDQQEGRPLAKQNLYSRLLSRLFGRFL
jgi:CDP-diacylglycerol--glycerol-3-phosphate 3-phosphatidyltransferase